MATKRTLKTIRFRENTIYDIVNIHKRWLIDEDEGTRAEIIDFDLSKLSFNGKDLRKAIFLNCNLSGTVFDVANLEEINFKNSNLSNSSFWKTYLFGANLKNVNLSNSDLLFANMQNADLTNSILKGANFSEVNLKNTKVTTDQLIRVKSLFKTKGINTNIKNEIKRFNSKLFERDSSFGLPYK